MIKVIKLTESDLAEIIKRAINESYVTKFETNSKEFPKLKDLKPYGLTYSVKSLKNLLISQRRDDGTYGNNKWNKESMPFPPELNILNVIFQSKIAQFYFESYAKDKGKFHYNWASLITKDALDNFPIPTNVFKTVVEVLTADKL